MADDSYYPDMSSSQDSAGDETENTDNPQEETDEGQYQTFLAPKSAFKGDVEPGQIEKIKFVHVYEDEVECQCVKDEEPKSAMSTAQDEISSMGGQ